MSGPAWAASLVAAMGGQTGDSSAGGGLAGEKGKVFQGKP